MSEDGEAIVVKSASTPARGARNSAGERAIASPAVARGRICLRADGHLFSIGSR